jgi:uncharacterized protein (TIGR02147 family)
MRPRSTAGSAPHEGPKPAAHPDVRDYSDYRKFLRELYASRKAANRNFSFRYLSLKAGINSSGFFKQIIEGRRNLTSGTIAKVCQALAFKEAEAEYFESLVLFNQAKTMRQKNLHFEKLIEQQKRRNFRRIPEDSYDYFAEWYHCVVRELAVFPGMGEDAAKVAAAVRPPITAKQAAQSLQLLLRLGLLRREGDSLRQADPLVSTGYGIKSHLVRKFQVDMLEKAIEMYDQPSTAADPRLMSCNVLAFKAGNYERFVEALRGLRSQLMALANEQPGPDTVYALNLNFFPVSRKTGNDVP